MTNDSSLFRTREELEEQEGAYPIGGNRLASPSGDWVPLYEGKMVQAFDHRAARVVVNPENQHRPAQPVPATLEAASECRLAARSAILGAGIGMRLAGWIKLGSRLQGNYSTHECQNVHRGAFANGWIRKQSTGPQTGNGGTQ